MKSPFKRTQDPYRVRIKEIRESIKKYVLDSRFRRDDGGFIYNLLPEALQTHHFESLILIMEESMALSNLTRSLRWLTVILSILTAILVLTSLGIKL